MGITSKVLKRTGPISPFGRAVLRELDKRVYIGIPAEGAARVPAQGEADTPTNAQIGYWQEWGVPEANIPARPHLIPGVESIGGKATDLLHKAAEAAFLGDLSAPEKALHTIGLLGQNAVRARITDGDFAPLAERTIKARIRRGRTGTKPLIDTGAYRRAITYVVTPRALVDDHK